MHALCLMVLLAAPAKSPLAVGVDLYERGLYDKSKAALAKVLDLPLPEAEQNQARLYLAADYFALKDRRAARYALEDLARKAPEQQLDASVFPPDFIALWEEARTQVSAERAQPPAANPPAQAAPPPVAPPATPPAPAPPVPVTAPPEPASTVSIAESPASPPHWPVRLVALVPAAAAIGLTVFGALRWQQSQADYQRLVGPTPPALLTDGQALAQQGRDANRDAVLGWSIAAAAAVAAVVLLIALWRI